MDEEQEQRIKGNIDRIQSQIQEAARRSGRERNEIELVAVTKKKSAAVVKTLAENGINKIGESYLQEALFKIDLLKDYDIEWHMIGNIQRGKEKQVARSFQVVHSVGKIDTAREINKADGAFQKKIPVYLEMNVSGETTKHGWPAWNDDNLASLQAEFEEIMDFTSLQIIGLMTMAPYSTNP